MISKEEEEEEEKFTTGGNIMNSVHDTLIIHRKDMLINRILYSGEAVNVCLRGSLVTAAVSSAVIAAVIAAVVSTAELGFLSK